MLRQNGEAFFCEPLHPKASWEKRWVNIQILQESEVLTFAQILHLQ